MIASHESDDRGPNSFELVQRAQGGESEALNELFARYYSRVRQVVRMRLGRDLRNHTESADILQETFEAAVNAFDRFEMRDESSLIHWLSKIAEHKIKGASDYFKARKRDGRGQVPIDPGASASGSRRGIDPSAGDSTPLEHAMGIEDVEILEAAMDDLSEDYREVILHHVYEKASWATVAQWMGLPGPDAARMKYARAMVELTGHVRRRGGRLADD